MGVIIEKQESTDEQEDEEDDDLFEVWRENEEVLSAFLKCQTQWVVAGMGGFIGLNYTAVQVVLSTYNSFTPEIFSGIQTMEFAALEVINRASK
jgi:hypothetical protein